MEEWKKVLVSPDATILEAIRIIDEGAQQVALVVEEEHKLIGIVTDGDVRRGILRGLSVESPVELIMNHRPITARLGDTKAQMISLMKFKHIHHLPIVDSVGRLIGVEYLDNVLNGNHKDNWVVLMAGGLGQRLRPLTDKCPKPMLMVGDRPILETIIDNFIQYGYHKFYISVNYKADMIKNYFGDGTKLGVEIRYLQEDVPLGTAGALSLLPERPSHPLLVMNGDILTKVNLQHLLEFHEGQGASGTMCVREYSYQVPYGVVQLERHRLSSIVEKPVNRFFVNGGIYVLEPSVLSLIPNNQYIDMPELFKTLISAGQETVAFPVREYWMDIGRLDDYERANGDYEVMFQ